MKFSRTSRIQAIALIIIFLTIPLFSQSGELLIQIPRDSGLTNDVLSETDLKICLREDDFYLASISETQLSILSNYDVEYTVIDADAWTGDYYLISDIENFKKGNALMTFNSRTLVKMDQNTAIEIAATGVPITRIVQRRLPLFTEKPLYLPEKQDYSAVSGIIEDAIAKVSEPEYLGYLQRLQDFQTRYALSDSTIAVRKWLKDKFTEFGYTDVSFDNFSGPQDSDQANVVAIKPGISETDRVIVIGGHYDSIVRDVKTRMTFAPGADDNGSGTAGTLELARVFADIELETTLIFVTFAAEELGLWGSEHYAESAADDGMNIDVMLNMDMIATLLDDVWDVNVRTDDQSTGFAELIASLTEEYTPLIPRFQNSGSASDHYPFQQFGYPAIFMQESDFSLVYHSTDDIIDYVTPEYAVEVVKSLVASIIVIANSPEIPENIVAIEPGDGTSQIFTWQENQDPDIAGYNIYLGESSGDYSLINAVSSNVDTITGLISDKSYYAAVSAFDVDGNESLTSTEIVFTPTAVPKIPLSLESTSKQDGIEISWDGSNQELDVTAYLITRVDDNSHSKSYEAGADETVFVDNSIEPHTLYKYYIQAKDKDNVTSPLSQSVKGQLATHDAGIFIVDGSKDGTNMLLRPSDEKVDDYYASMLNQFEYNGNWDLLDNTEAGNDLSDADLAKYSTVIWHSDISPSMHSLSQDTVAIKKYVDNGGKLILIGWSLFDNLLKNNPSGIEFIPGEFAYNYLQTVHILKSTAVDQDFKGANSQIAGYPDIRVDPEKVTVFNNNLVAMEIFQTLVEHENTETLYTYHSSAEPPSQYHGKPVAFKHLSERLKLAIINFPLFFMNENESKKLIERVLLDFGEEQTIDVADENDNTEVPAQFHLAQNYPNPFNGTTHIHFSLPVQTNVKIVLFNMKGEYVATLIDKQIAAGSHHINFDANDLTSGIYLYKLITAQYTAAKKLVYLK